MKTEEELSCIASDFEMVLAENRCNCADVYVILGMLQHNVWEQVSRGKDKFKEGYTVKIE